MPWHGQAAGIEARQRRMRSRCWKVHCPFGNGHLGRHAPGSRSPDLHEIFDRVLAERNEEIAANVRRNNVLLERLSLRRSA